MKKLTRSFAQTSALILTTFTIQSAIAAEETSSYGLFVEPAVTYETGTTETNYPSPFSNSSGEIYGIGLGAKAGLHISEVIFLGIDLRYSMPEFKDSSVDYTAQAISTNWGPFVGMQMPDIGLRLWGGYILRGDLDPEKSGSFDIKLVDGTGYRVGVGFHIESVSLNLEYQQMTYAEAQLQQLGPFATNSTFDDVDLENKSWIASVSFPIEL